MEQLNEKENIKNEFDDQKKNLNKEVEITKSENLLFRKDYESIIDLGIEKNKELESIISLKELALIESNKINSGIHNELEEFKRA